MIIPGSPTQIPPLCNNLFLLSTCCLSPQHVAVWLTSKHNHWSENGFKLWYDQLLCCISDHNADKKFNKVCVSFYMTNIHIHSLYCLILPYCISLSLSLSLLRLSVCVCACISEANCHLTVMSVQMTHTNRDTNKQFVYWVVVMELTGSMTRDKSNLSVCFFCLLLLSLFDFLLSHKIIHCHMCLYALLCLVRARKEQWGVLTLKEICFVNLWLNSSHLTKKQSAESQLLDVRKKMFIRGSKQWRCICGLRQVHEPYLFLSREEWEYSSLLQLSIINNNQHIL